MVLACCHTQWVPVDLDTRSQWRCRPCHDHCFANRETDRAGGFVFNGLEGELDEVSLWTVELSQSDVTAIYNSGTPTDLSSSGISGLINWWRNGDPTGTAAYPTIVDQVGSNNGTMTNMTDTQIVTSVP